MNRQVLIQSLATLQRVEITAKNRINPKTPETVQAHLRHHPMTKTTNGSDGGNQKRGRKIC
jgi:hypothetical protein